MNFSKILEQLVLKQEINRQLNPIVIQANDTVTLLKPSGGKESKMQENQIRNVVNVANDSRNIEVVTNFIRYQIGRSKSGEQWQYGKFGEQVIQDIESGVVAKSAQSAVAKSIQEIEKRNELVDKESLLHQAYVNLMLLYLGYLNRAFCYCEKSGDPKGWDRLRKGKEDKNVS